MFLSLPISAVWLAATSSLDYVPGTNGRIASPGDATGNL